MNESVLDCANCVNQETSYLYHRIDKECKGISFFSEHIISMVQNDRAIRSFLQQTVMMINRLILTLLTVNLISCVSTDFPVVEKPRMREPKSTAKVYKPTGEWNVRSESDLSNLKKLGAKISRSEGVISVNLNGIILDGSKQKGDGSQSENQTPLLRARVPLVLKNGFVDNNKNALTFYAPNSGVENITWLDVGEDAVATVEGAKNFFVTNCEFTGASDKSIQLNEADGAKVYKNTIHGGVTGVRLGEIDYTERNNRAFCGENSFFGVDTAWNVAKLTLTETKPNKYNAVRKEYVLVEGAKLKK